MKNHKILTIFAVVIFSATSLPVYGQELSAPFSYGEMPEKPAVSTENPEKDQMNHPEIPPDKMLPESPLKKSEPEDPSDALEQTVTAQEIKTAGQTNENISPESFALLNNGEAKPEYPPTGEDSSSGDYQWLKVGEEKEEVDDIEERDLRIAALNEEIASIEAKQIELQEELDNIKKQQNALEPKIKVLEREKRRLESQLKSAEKMVINQESRIQQMEDALTEMTAYRVNLEKLLSNAKTPRLIRQILRKIAQMNKKIAILQNNINKKLSVIAKLKEKVDHLQNQIGEVDSKLQPLLNERGLLASKALEILREKEANWDSIRRLREKIAALMAYPPKKTITKDVFGWVWVPRSQPANPQPSGLPRRVVAASVDSLAAQVS